MDTAAEKSALSRRRMLTIALGGAATVALPAPAWAAGDTRPGAVRPPTLTDSDLLVANRVSAVRA
ncbi:MAG TPA: Zn-dependent exopeptidase M28, partial [Actinoplanes sp.]|nr:Zn-dependent exopeptidase M28 [Actinoplanes sp.]